ncbi:hypothetical protein TNCV_2079501 [Trichonephila clavipes]|nr:hypothetical protein TNCV_2079501 [Trichonephila clavipes]
MKRSTRLPIQSVQHMINWGCQPGELLIEFTIVVIILKYQKSQCKTCTEAQLTSDHILECPAFTPHIIRLGMVPLASELREVLYSADAPRLAEAVQRTHDII